MASIGRDLDLKLAEITRRITCIEEATYAQLKKLEVELTNQIVRVAAQGNVDDLADKETVLGIEADLTSQVERLETELNDRIDELEGFDPDDLRCDLESRIDDVQDSVSYMDDRIDDIESYKITEEEVEYMLDTRLSDMDDVISDKVTDCVCDEINTRAVGFTEYLTLCDRVRELEDRLNRPTLGARILRWLREGPSAKELATKWYAGLRRVHL